MEKAVREYLRTVKRQVNGSPAKRAKVLEQLETDILLDAESHDVTDVSEIVAKFGAPEDIAESFLQTADFAETRRNLNYKRRIVRIVCTITAIAVVILIALMAFHVADVWSFNHGYGVEGPAIVGTPPPNETAIGTY